MELASAIQKGFTRNFRYTEQVAIHVANYIATLQADTSNSLSIAIRVEEDLTNAVPFYATDRIATQKRFWITLRLSSRTNPLMESSAVASLLRRARFTHKQHVT